MKRYIVIAIACSLPLLMSAQKGKEYYEPNEGSQGGLCGSPI